VKIRDGFKQYPSIAEFKQILGVSVTDDTLAETLTNQIVQHMCHGSPLSVSSQDALLMIGGTAAFGNIDPHSDSGRHTIRARMRSIAGDMENRTPDRLKASRREASHGPAKARLDLIRAQTSEIPRDVGPMQYTADGELDHDEFCARINSLRPAWMPDDWWPEVRSDIIEKSIPEWQNTRVTPKMIRCLRNKMRQVFECVTN